MRSYGFGAPEDIVLLRYFESDQHMIAFLYVSWKLMAGTSESPQWKETYLTNIHSYLGFYLRFCVCIIFIYIYNFTNYNKKKNSNADKKYIYNIYIIYIDKLWRGSRTRWHHPFCQFPLQGNMWNLRFDELESRNLENQQGFVQSGDLSWIELLRTIKLMVDLGVDIDQVTGNFSSLYTCF